MLKDILDFLGHHGVGIFIFLLFFGGGIGAFFNRLIAQRHARKMQAEQYAYRLKILAERRLIAEREDDAIKLLIADDALGEDFNRRLAAALKKAKEGPPQTRVMIDSEIDSEEEEVAEAGEERSPRKSRARRKKAS